MCSNLHVLEPVVRKLAIVLPLVSLGFPFFSCGGSEFAGDTSSDGGAMGGATASGGNGGASGQTVSSTVAGGSGGRGQGGAGGSPNPDASNDAAESDTGRADAIANDVVSDIATSDAPTVLGRCSLDTNQCPSGYQCGCGGPGPGICECHKKCQSAADCGAPNAMCGCSPNDAVKICVSLCFCACQ